MDLTFVKVFADEGLDAPVESFQHAFAYADYHLCHANQQARYNILNGIKAGTTGHWTVNPHADDIDFQIEADYAGIMAPGMVKTAVHYTDDIGQIMNYGDGWYGGVYVAAMYALAFISDDVEYVVEEALKVIPQQSRYWRCMNDVIQWHNKVYGMSYGQALQVIAANRGKVTDENVVIKVQKPSTVRFEEAFAGHFPESKTKIGKSLSEPLKVELDGIGVAVEYRMETPDNDYVAEVEASLDGSPAQKILLPADFKIRRLELFHAYNLEDGPHTIEFKWLNPVEGCRLTAVDKVTYIIVS